MSLSTCHFIKYVLKCACQRDPTNARYTHIQVDICLMQHVPVVIRASGTMESVLMRITLGNLLNLVIAKLTDDLVGLLVERDAVARTVVEIRGTTLRSPPVRICRVTFEVSW